MRSFGESLLTIFFFTTLNMAHATILTPVFNDEGIVSDSNNSFIDPSIDYSRFVGRVTDKDDSGKILKIYVENNNTKFLKAGDLVYFKVNNHDDRNFCKASVNGVEDNYFSVYVQDFNGCWSDDKFFPRGLQLNFKTDLMATRVFEASEYRKILLMRKESFVKQLNDINSFVWTFQQQKLKTAIEFDQKINDLKREKQLALDNLIQKKQENLLLQSELIQRLDDMDEDLNHYRVERKENFTDRWNLDQDVSLPFGERPTQLKRP